MLAPLEGFVVGVTADRRAEEQAELLARRGARVVHGPVIRTLPFALDDALRDATRAVLDRAPDFVIANTGIGIRGWLSAAATWGCDDALAAALARARVVARGPKAAGAVHALGLDVWWRAPGESLDEVLARLLAEPLDGRRIAFQLHGGRSPAVTAALRSAGADVVEVPVYRWQLPEDRAAPASLIERVCNGDVDAVTFTSAPAVENFLTLAGGLGREADVRDAFGGRVVPVGVGPYSAGAARELGLTGIVEPVAARLGSMVRAVQERLGEQRLTIDVDGRLLEVQGRAVGIREQRGIERSVWLSTRERWLLARLLHRPGAVVSRAELCRAVWRGDADDHVLDVTIARLRRRLGPAGAVVETATKRGYRVRGDVVGDRPIG